MSIAENIKIVKDKIGEYAFKSGRNPDEIILIAVTKNVSLESIREAIDLGITHIGENRVQEAKSKLPILERIVNRHMLGHLQSNKVKPALELFDMIQSVDQLELAQNIQKRANTISKIQPILIEINTSGESTKSGCSPLHILELIQQIYPLSNIKIQGLMTIGPLTDNKTKIRDSFRLLREIFEKCRQMDLPNLNMKYLSMGMSQDYDIAIEEGSNMLRIGTAIFGDRK